MDLIYLLLGLALILGGANYLTDGAAAIAKRFQISEFVVGLTIVAIGTSMPEMVVSVISSIDGNGDIAVGNVVGSNIFNTFAILGICALMRPMQITRDNIRKDIPLGILASVVLIAVSYSGRINSLHGVVMVLIWLALMLYAIKSSKRAVAKLQLEPSSAKPSLEEQESMRPIVAWLLICGGLAALIGGGELFLRSAVGIAESFGISQKVIAITLVAGGTSFPELAASVVSLLKGKGDIALGNVIGSNVANVFLVLGVSSAVTPLSIVGITIFDMLVVLAGMLLLLAAPFVPTKKMLGRPEAVVLILCFVLYMYHVIA